MLRVHVSFRVQRHCIETPKPRSETSAISEEGIELGPHPPPIFAQVFILRLLTRVRRMSLLSERSALALFILSRLPELFPSDAARNSLSVAAVRLPSAVTCCNSNARGQSTSASFEDVLFYLTSKDRDSGGNKSSVESIALGQEISGGGAVPPGDRGALRVP